MLREWMILSLLTILMLQKDRKLLIAETLKGVTNGNHHLQTARQPHSRSDPC